MECCTSTAILHTVIQINPPQYCMHFPYSSYLWHFLTALESLDETNAGLESLDETAGLESLDETAGLESLEETAGLWSLEETAGLESLDESTGFV